MKENKKINTKLTRKRKKGGDRGKGTSSLRCFFSFFLKVDTLSMGLCDSEEKSVRTSSLIAVSGTLIDFYHRVKLVILRKSRGYWTEIRISECPKRLLLLNAIS